MPKNKILLCSVENDFTFFSLEYKGQHLKIEKATIKDQVVFHVTFIDETKPLVIGRIMNFHEKKIWTSFPEGRQKEAEEIGLLIVNYYLSLKN
jgi:hypothetical protein